MTTRNALPPSFWNEFVPPTSAIAEAVQRPLYRITPEAVICAYFKDSEAARKSRAAPLQHPNRGGAE